MRSQPYTPYPISIDAEPNEEVAADHNLHHVLPSLLAFRREATVAAVTGLDHPDTDTFGSDGFAPSDRI